jgi:hypothetical protein
MTDWATFATALADDLPKLADGDTVILEYGEPYVQFTQAESVLYADTRGGDGARLSALGWRAPEPAMGTPNWWTEVPWPLSVQDSRQLGDLMLATLRDVYGAPGPDALAYQAFNSRTGADLDLPALAGATRTGS